MMRLEGSGVYFCLLLSSKELSRMVFLLIQATNLTLNPKPLRPKPKLTPRTPEP